MSSFALYNLVRALTKPYVGAHIDYQGKEVKIWKLREEAHLSNNLEPGKVLKVEGNEILVKTYDGAVRLIEHDFEQLPTVNDYL